jgi:aarF domain-containing kinase
MAGKRLLDVAALFNAARGVAQKHVAFRARQVDVYNRTSTLARAVRHQTDRITETVKAASFLTSRLNENAPTWASEAGSVDSIPRKETTTAPSRTKPRAEIDQEHFNENSPRHSAIGGPLEDDLEVQQEEAHRYPLPDGTIPSEGSSPNTLDLDQEVLASRPQYGRLQLNYEKSRQVSKEASISLPRRPPTTLEAARTIHRQSELQIPSKTADAYDDYVPVDSLAAGHDEDSFYKKSLQSSPTFSSLPRIKVPKHTSASQGRDFHPSEQQINSDSFYNPTITGPKNETISSLKTVPDQEQVPDGVRTDLFHSPRLARSLGGTIQRPTEENLTLKSAKDTTPDHTRLSSGKDSFYDRRSLHEKKTAPGEVNTTYETPIQRPEFSKDDRKDLAQDTVEERRRTEQMV